MKRDEALRILKANHDALAALGVQSLSLFGSVARDEAGPTSDVDVLVEFSGPATFNGYFDLLEHLEEQLGCTVDLVMMDALKPRMRPYVEKEMIRVAGHGAPAAAAFRGNESPGWNYSRPAGE